MGFLCGLINILITVTKIRKMIIQAIPEVLQNAIGGGIGQSRLCMLMIGTCHIGEVQASLWDKETMEACEKAGVMIL